MTNAISTQSIKVDYPLPASRYRNGLWALASQAKQKQTKLEAQKRSDDAMAINNALYLVLIKYIPKVKVVSDAREYLLQLLAAVKSAKYEFSEVCYDNSHASEVMQWFTTYLVGEISYLEKAKQSNTALPMRTLNLLKTSLTSAPIAFLYYLTPILYFGMQKPRILWFIAPPFIIAFGIHVYLMANEPDEPKGWELVILATIYMVLLGYYFVEI